MKMGRFSLLILPFALYSVQCGIIQVGYDDAVQHVFTHDEAESYKTLYVDGDYLYIGAASLPQIDGPGYLFKVDKNNISDTTYQNITFDIVDNPATGAIQCRNTTPEDARIDLCRNFIKVILTDPAKNNNLLVCGTNALYPDCYNVDTTTFTEDVTVTLSGQYKCPPKNDQRVASVFGNDNQLYSATTHHSDGTSIIARFPTSSDPLDLQTENDAKWLKSPEFISTYKVTPTNGEAEILIFFREEGDENINQYPQKLTYSRVARVCEGDNGGNTNILVNRWATYLKARLDCSATSSDFPDFEQFYDVLEDTEFVAGTDAGTVYAVFTANRNGESMSALCSYSVDAMPDVFDSNKYWHQQSVNHVWSKVEPSFSRRPGECVADSTTLGDDVLNALKEHPHMEPLIPSQRPPLLTSYTGVKFTQIISTTVDSELILYIGTDRGTVLKVLYNGTQPIVLEEVQVYDSTTNPEPVTAMAKSEDDKVLYIGFNDRVVQVPMYQCHRYTDCSQCNGAGDPHCGWDETSDQCIFDTNPATSCPTPDVETIEVLYGDVGLASCNVRNGKWYHESTELTIDNVKYTVIDGLGLLVADFRKADNGEYTMKSDSDAELCVTRLEIPPIIFLEPNTTSQNAVVCDGKDLYLYCRAKGPSDLTITWHGPDDSELSVDCDGVNLNGNSGGNFESIVWCNVNSAISHQTFTCKAGSRLEPMDEREKTMVTVEYEACLDEEDSKVEESINWEVDFHYHMKKMADWEDETVNSGTCQYGSTPVLDVGTCDCYCEDP